MLWSIAWRRTAGVRVRETAEAVGVPLSGMVLERVRVRGIDTQAAGFRESHELCRILGPVPGNVNGDRRRDADQRVDSGAVLHLLDDRPGLAGNRKPARIACPRRQRPRRQRDSELHGDARQRLDVYPASGELPAEVRIVRFEG